MSEIQTVRPSRKQTATPAAQSTQSSAPATKKVAPVKAPATTATARKAAPITKATSADTSSTTVDFKVSDKKIVKVKITNWDDASLQAIVDQVEPQRAGAYSTTSVRESAYRRESWLRLLKSLRDEVQAGNTAKERVIVLDKQVETLTAEVTSLRQAATTSASEHTRLLADTRLRGAKDAQMAVKCYERIKHLTNDDNITFSGGTNGATLVFTLEFPQALYTMEISNQKLIVRSVGLSSVITPVQFTPQVFNLKNDGDIDDEDLPKVCMLIDAINIGASAAKKKYGESLMRSIFDSPNGKPNYGTTQFRLPRPSTEPFNR